MRELFVATLAAACCGGVGYAAASSTADVSVASFSLPTALPPCGIATAVVRLVRATDVPIAIERTSRCQGENSFPRLDVTAATRFSRVPLRTVLDVLVALDPSYAWAEKNGAISVRPISAVHDMSNVLNSSIPAVSLKQTTAAAVLSHLLAVPVNGEVDQNVFDFSFAGGTLADALDILMRADHVVWDAGLIIHPDARAADGDPSLMVSLRTLHGGGISVATPVRRLITPTQMPRP